MEWSRPFDILLKYKCFAEAEGGKDVYKKEGQPASLVDCPLMSKLLNEVRTFFIEQYSFKTV
jgi:hypothetical protein